MVSGRKAGRTIPKTLGQVADRLYQVRQERLAKQAEVDELQAFETQLKNYVIDELPKSDAGGVSGRLANVRVSVKQVFSAQDWDEVHAHIQRTGGWDLMQRRLNDAAVRERLENGEAVPGVVARGVPFVSVTKL